MSSAAKGKSRLGRGLSSLISVSELPVEAEVPVEPPAQVGAADLPSVATPPAVPGPVSNPAAGQRVLDHGIRSTQKQMT